ncbi:MAG TPA: hypothetical protein VIZ19_10760, partial [Roseiarcus sp.]
DTKISSTVRFGHVMDGPLAACSQFGPVICNNDIRIVEAGDPLPIKNGTGSIPCRDSRCQNAIYDSRCVDE